MYVGNYKIDTPHAILIIGCKKVIAKVDVIQKVKVPSVYIFLSMDAYASRNIRK